jgi:dienelactone hydrolase
MREGYLHRFQRAALRWLLVAGPLALLGCGDGDPVGSGARALPEGYEERYHEGMRYGLFVPPSYDAARRYPLVVSLHGSTDTTSWDLSWYHEPILSADPAIVLTPKTLRTRDGWGTGWQPEHSEDLQRTLAVVDLLRAAFNVDSTRLYVYGSSMGGFGVFSVLAKEPGLFAAAFSICGGGNPTTAVRMKETPLWIFHGSADPVVPVDFSRNMYRAIREAGGRQVRYTEYPGVGHDAWTPAWAEPTLEAWLLAQRKGAVHGPPDTAEHLRYAVLEPARVRLSWDPPSSRAHPDNQVWYYRVFRDQQLLAEVDSTTFVDFPPMSTVAPAYSVSTVSYFFQESGRTAPLTVRRSTPSP